MEAVTCEINLSPIQFTLLYKLISLQNATLTVESQSMLIVNYITTRLTLAILDSVS